MKTTITNKDGSITYYGFACGYIEEYNHPTREYHYARLILENSEIALFSIQGFYNNKHFWIQTTGLTNARRVYKKVKLLLKKELNDELYNEILKLDEGYENK